MGQPTKTMPGRFDYTQVWRPNAACAGPGIDPELFHEHGGDGAVARAKAICHTCPIMDACLTFGLRNENSGIWGGLTAHERYRIGGRRPAVRKG
ncbi:WhiB family transcriptional regulator [Streptomyces sp. NPDC058701]|uniref:WhiB family transcriptional regulator n=1 Tax=Streptomyces sp. NPDC058701 TaxID=3346608 RepID=UPI003659CC1F